MQRSKGDRKRRRDTPEIEKPVGVKGDSPGAGGEFRLGFRLRKREFGSYKRMTRRSSPPFFVKLYDSDYRKVIEVAVQWFQEKDGPYFPAYCFRKKVVTEMKSGYDTRTVPYEASVK